MTDTFQDQIKETLGKTKVETTNRVGRIGDILKTAVSQAVTEVREGSGEIRAIATESISSVTSTVNSTSSEEKSANSFLALIQAIQTRLVAEFSSRWQVLDAKLATRYGDRYDSGKQRVNRVNAWYSNARANSETPISDFLAQKQAAVGERVGNAGATIAHREQQLRDRLKTFVESATVKF